MTVTSSKYETQEMSSSEANEDHDNDSSTETDYSSSSDEEDQFGRNVKNIVFPSKSSLKSMLI